MNEKPQAPAVCFALLLGFAGLFALYGPLLRSVQPLPAETLHAPVDTTTPAADTVASVEAPSAPVATNLSYEEALRHPRPLTPLPPEMIDPETLWLARCIFSETKRPEEQELVAWVIRNRVETRYRGNGSYREAVLDPYQFSAFNPTSDKRDYYATLHPDMRVPGWRRALLIAHLVRNQEADSRPFSIKTRHFYSERSMRGGKMHPAWAEGHSPVTPQRDYDIQEERFRFFEGVS